VGRYDSSGLTRDILKILGDRKRHRLAYIIQEVGPANIPSGVAIESWETSMRAVRKHRGTKNPLDIPEERKVQRGYQIRVLDALRNLRLIRTRDETGLVVKLNPEVLACRWCHQPFFHYHRNILTSPACDRCMPDEINSYRKGKRHEFGRSP